MYKVKVILNVEERGGFFRRSAEVELEAELRRGAKSLGLYIEGKRTDQQNNVDQDNANG